MFKFVALSMIVGIQFASAATCSLSVNGGEGNVVASTAGRFSTRATSHQYSCEAVTEGSSLSVRLLIEDGHGMASAQGDGHVRLDYVSQGYKGESVDHVICDCSL